IITGIPRSSSTDVCVRVCVCVCMCVCACVCEFMCVCEHVCVACVDVNDCVRMCACVCVSRGWNDEWCISVSQTQEVPHNSPHLLSLGLWESSLLLHTHTHTHTHTH